MQETGALQICSRGAETPCQRMHSSSCLANIMHWQPLTYKIIYWQLNRDGWQLHTCLSALYPSTSALLKVVCALCVCSYGAL